MSFRGDDRGQAIQIGAVLLFAVLVIAFSLYQAFVVPNQNEQVEANHLQRVAGDMLTLRNGIVSVSKSGTGSLVSVALGTTYPARLFALNPPPPSGRLRTVGTGDGAVKVTIADAKALDGETADYWNGTTRTYGTGSVVYTPDYNEFRHAPALVYDTTTLFRRFDTADLWTTGQTLIDGRTITLVTINGSYDRSSSRTVSVPVDPLSASRTTVAITNETGENVTISFASMQNASEWRSLLSEEKQFVNQSGYVIDVTERPIPNATFDLVTLELARNVTYKLRMAKVGIGTDTTVPPESYLTDIAGDGVTVPEGSHHTLVVGVRDRFNNPVAGVEVTASVGSGSLLNATAVTGTDGRAEFTYVAENISGITSRQVQINITLANEVGASFDPDAPKNVSMTVTVQNSDRSGLGGGGDDAYTVIWEKPTRLNANDDAVLNCSSSDSCTWNVGKSTSSSLSLQTVLTPRYEGVALEFAVNNSRAGTVSPTTATTGKSGTAMTELQAHAAGIVDVLVSGNAGSDRIAIKIVNLIGLFYNSDATASPPGYDEITEKAMVSFNITNQYSGPITITGFSLNSSSVNDISIRELQGQDVHEVWIDQNGDGDPDGYYDRGRVYVGDTVSLDVQPTINASETAEIRLYHFEQMTGFFPPLSSWSPVSMVDEDVTIALHYVGPDRNRHTKTIQMRNIPD